jgi:hypothetical protein
MVEQGDAPGAGGNNVKETRDMMPLNWKAENGGNLNIEGTSFL